MGADKTTRRLKVGKELTPMDEILTQLEENVNKVFDDDYLEMLARETGFMKRKKKINPKDFLVGFISTHPLRAMEAKRWRVVRGSHRIFRKAECWRAEGP